MLTLFSPPKSFRGHFAIIQINAIRSWLRLKPACEIILLGNEEGVEETASQFGIHRILGIVCLAIIASVSFITQPIGPLFKFGLPGMDNIWQPLGIRGRHDPGVWRNGTFSMGN